MFSHARAIDSVVLGGETVSDLRGMSIAWGMRLWSWVAASRTGDQSVQRPIVLGKQRDSGTVDTQASWPGQCLPA